MLKISPGSIFPELKGGNIRKKKNKQNITRIQPPAMGQKDSTVWEYKILELFVRAVPTFLPTYVQCMPISLYRKASGYQLHQRYLLCSLM